MAGRAGYSDALARLSRSELEAALATLSARSRKLLERTEIDGAAHKTVAAEFGLSLRQFYRARSTAIRSILSAEPCAQPGEAPPAPSIIPAAVRMTFVRISAAIRRCDPPSVRSALHSLDEARASLGQDLHPIADVMLAIGEAALARAEGDAPRTRAALRDVLRLARDPHQRYGLGASVAYGLSALVSLAHDALQQGNTDGAVALANDVLLIAADLSDIALQIEAETVLASAYLTLPCHLDEAHTRATASLHRCRNDMQPEILARCVRALASSFAELNCPENALLLRDIVQPLIDKRLAHPDRWEHLTWSAGIELSCGSATRAAALAESIRRQVPAKGRLWIMATIVRADALGALEFWTQSLALAEQAYAVCQRSAWRGLTGQSLLSCARGSLARNEPGKARKLIAAALPLLDRSALVSVQRSAYRLSFAIAKDPLHALLDLTYAQHL